MNVLRETQRLRRESLELQYEFVAIELDLAQTFCDIALAADQDAKAWRNLEYARRALDTASKFAEQIQTRGGIFPRAVSNRFRDVGSQLANLGRRLHADLE